MLRLRLEKKTVEEMAGKFNRRLQFSTDKALDNLQIELSYWLYNEQLKGTQRAGMPGGWPVLNKSYAQEKERNFPGRPILTRTGVLMETYPRYITINKWRREVALGFPRGKIGMIAQVHQSGSKDGRIPPRPFPVDQAGYDAFEEIAYRNYANAIREALNG